MKVHLLWLPCLVACASEEAVKVYNNTPTVTIVSHSGSEVFQDGYEINFQAQVQDDNHENSSLEVVWSTGVRTLCPPSPPTADGISQCRVALEEGESVVRVQVTDPEDAASIAEINISVEATFAPTVDILSPTAQGLYYSDQLMLFSAQIADNEDASSDLTYEWESSLDGVLSTTATPNEDGLLEEYLYLSEGTHALTLKATDLSGKSTEKSISLQVGGPNTDPSCAITAPSMGDSFVLGDAIIFQATASDTEIDTDELEIMWISDKDGDLGTGVVNSSGSVSLSYSDLSANTHTIQFLVKDELESTCSDSIIISVNTKTPPEITLLSPLDGAVITAGDFVNFQGTVLDNEDAAGDIGISWSSNIDGVFSTQGATSSGDLIFNTSSLSAGLHSITVTATDSSGLTDAAVLGVRINNPPSAPTVIINPATPSTMDALTVSATGASDADGHNVQLSYEWYNNSVLTTNVGSVLASSETTKGDTWTVRVTPNDGYQDGDYTEASIYIDNTSPSASVLLNTTEASTSDTVTCTGTSSDADGDTLTETYQWENQTTGVMLGTSSSLTFSPLSVSPGDSVVCIYTVDDSTITDSSSAVLSITNTDPTIDAISIVPTNPFLGDTLTCMGSVSDEDLEALTETYQWENQTTGALLSTDISLELDTSNASPNDVIACTLSVVDPSGGSDSDIATVSVGNLAPTIDSLSFDLASVAIGDTITCLSSVSDPEGEIPNVVYDWENNTSGTTIGSGASLTLTASMATGLDEISCTATATDSYGDADTETISIFVDETVPTFDTEASIAPNSGLTTSSTLSCTGVASDPDGTNVTLSYSWSVGTTTLGTSQSLTLSPNSVQPTDLIQCMITATDAAGEQATSSATAMIGNTAPALSDIAITPSTGLSTSSTLTCSVLASDADLESLTPTYTWEKNGSPLGTGVSLTLTPTMIQPEESVTCVASVTDGFGATAELSTTAEIGNSDPVIDSVTIAPSTSYNDSTLSCSVVSSDADNQSLSTVYEWSNATTGVVLGSSSSMTLDSSMASRNDVILCQVTVQDSTGGSVMSSASQSLDNRPPDAPTVSLTPSTAYADSILTCSASGTDIDGDSVSYGYAWSINGGALIATTETLSAAFAAGETVQCTATSNDGLIDGSSSSQSIVISNTAPIIDSVTLSPDPVYTDQNLSATASSSDLDGDSLTLTYTWSVEGSIVQTGTTDILDSSLFSKNELVEVSVTANDGADNSTAVSDSVTVSNTIPTAPSIALSPSVPIEQLDNLVCSVGSGSTDIDSDAVSYSFSWTVDGTPYTSATSTAMNSTISSSETTGGESWVCTVTPFDGEDDGDIASLSVSIDSGSYDSCEDAYNSGNTTDGFYTLDNANITESDVYCDMSYGTGGWTQCYTLVNTSSTDQDNNRWFDDCVDFSLASWSGVEVMIKLEDQSGSILYQAYGSRSNVWTYDQITSSTSSSNQYHSPEHNYLISLNNSDKLFIAGHYSDNSGYGGSFGNGYGIVVYPTNPNYFSNPKMIVASYLHKSGSPRSFYDWSPSHEISFDAGNTFHTGVSTPPQLGTFSFYVR